MRNSQAESKLEKENRLLANGRKLRTANRGFFVRGDDVGRVYYVS